MKKIILLIVTTLIAQTLFADGLTQILPVKRRFRQVVLKPLPMKDGKIDLVTFFSTAAGANDRLGLNEKGMTAFTELKAIPLAQENKFLRNWKRFIRQSATFGTMDIEALVQSIMMDASLNSQADLRDILNDMDANTQKKKAARAQLDKQNELLGDCVSQKVNCSNNLQGSLAAKIAMTQAELNLLSDMSESDAARLQQMMDAYSKLMSALSNLIKKMDDTASGIVSNMK